MDSSRLESLWTNRYRHVTPSGVAWTASGAGGGSPKFTAEKPRAGPFGHAPFGRLLDPSAQPPADGVPSGWVYRPWRRATPPAGSKNDRGYDLSRASTRARSTSPAGTRTFAGVEKGSTRSPRARSSSSRRQSEAREERGAVVSGAEEGRRQSTWYSSRVDRARMRSPRSCRARRRSGSSGVLRPPTSRVARASTLPVILARRSAPPSASSSRAACAKIAVPVGLLEHEVLGLDEIAPCRRLAATEPGLPHDRSSRPEPGSGIPVPDGLHVARRRPPAACQDWVHQEADGRDRPRPGRRPARRLRKEPS